MAGYVNFFEQLRLNCPCAYLPIRLVDVMNNILLLFLLLLFCQSAVWIYEGGSK